MTNNYEWWGKEEKKMHNFLKFEYMINSIVQVSQEVLHKIVVHIITLQIICSWLNLKSEYQTFKIDESDTSLFQKIATASKRSCNELSQFENYENKVLVYLLHRFKYDSDISYVFLCLLKIL